MCVLTRTHAFRVDDVLVEQVDVESVVHGLKCGRTEVATWWSDNEIYQHKYSKNSAFVVQVGVGDVTHLKGTVSSSFQEGFGPSATLVDTVSSLKETSMNGRTRTCEKNTIMRHACLIISMRNWEISRGTRVLRTHISCNVLYAFRS